MQDKELDTLGQYRIDISRLTIWHDSVLGRGGFGTVKLGALKDHRDATTSTTVAVKQLRSDQAMDLRVAYVR